MKDREFERFIGGPTVASRKTLHVAISPDRRFYLNANAHRLLGRPEAVYLFFKRSTHTIGIQKASPRLPDAFPVRLNAREGAIIHAAPFLNHFGVQIDQRERFINADINDEGVLLLDLTQTAVISRPRKKKL